MSTKVLVVGYGNIGRSVLKTLPAFPDLELVGIVSRRPQETAAEVGNIPVFGLIDGVESAAFDLDVDVAIMCGGSRIDLPEQTPAFAKHFSVVDSFDTHGKIQDHVQKVGDVCRANKTTAHIGIGWDPGSFSFMRAIINSCLPSSKAHGFYGLSPDGGLSMGHTNAIKEIHGVVDARQNTHAIQEAIDGIREGTKQDPLDGEKHWRECLVVVAPDADKSAIHDTIVNMPIYFAPYRTVVNFVTQQELDKYQGNQAHDGLVIGTGPAGYMEFRNVWKSNPDGTAGFMLAYARATHRLNSQGIYECRTVLDTAPALLLADPSTRLSLV